MRLAGDRVRRALASTVEVSLASIASGAAEGTDIGGIGVTTGSSPYTIVLTDDAGGKVKLNDSATRLLSGATATDYATSPSFTVSGKVIFGNTERVSWTGTITVLPSIPVTPTAIVYPGDDWTGVAGSGFTVAKGYPGGTGVQVADPVRVTAKPAVRGVLTSRHRFVADYPFGVRCVEKGGIAKIIVHIEGNRFEITDETTITQVDHFGGPNWVMPAHWFTIDWGQCVTTANPSGDGALQFYVETVPTNAAMQRRVVGPYFFYRASTLYDFQLQVSPSLSEVVGSRYKTASAALDYLASQPTANNNLITLTESGLYSVARSGTAVTNRLGVTRVVAAPGVSVTIGRPTLGFGVDPSSMDPKYDGLQFYQDASTGSLTIDNANFTSMPYTSIQHTAVGVTITNSNGPYALLQKAEYGYSGYSSLGGGKPVMPIGAVRFCNILNQAYGLVGMAANYNRISYCSNDLFTNSGVVIGNRISHCDTTPYTNAQNALTVQYAAGGGTITKTTGHVFTLTDPAGTASITLGVRPSNSYYYVSQLVAWINSRAGWTATLVSDDRFCRSLAAVTSLSATTVRTLTASFGPHADYRQIETTFISNAISADNICYDNSWQNYILSPSTPCEDVYFVNEAHHNSRVFSTQMSKTHKNVNFIHCSFANQNISLRADVSYNPDSYCAFINCVMPQIAWSASGTRIAPALTTNHVMGATVAEDTTGSSGGSMSSVFVDAANGNFTPKGELLSNLITPAAKFDAYGTLRAASDAKGAVAKP